MSHRLIAAALFIASAFGQALPLRLEATVPVFGIQGGINMGAIRCDSDANVYFRTYVPEQILAAPVVKIVPDGTKYVSFDVGPWKEDPNARPQVRDYALGDSELLLLTLNETPPAQLVRFDLDGKYKSVSKLDVAWDPARVAFLAEAGILVFGSRTVPNGRGKPSLVPVAGIFNTTGQFVKTVPVPLPTTADAKDPNAAVLEMIEKLLIDSGPGGVYIMPPVSPPSLVVLAPTGEFTRKLDLASPGDGFRPSSLHVTPEQIVVEYSRAAKGQGDEMSYVVYELTGGRRIASYTGADVSGNLACYDHTGTFIFLSVRDAQRVMVRARP